MPKESRAGKCQIHVQHLCLFSGVKQDISTPTTLPALKIWLVLHTPATQIFQCPFDYRSTFLAMISCKGKFMTWPKQTTVTTAYLCSTAGESPSLKWGGGYFWRHHLLFYFCSILGISFVVKQKQSASHPFWQEEGSNCLGTNKCVLRIEGRSYHYIGTTNTSLSKWYISIILRLFLHEIFPMKICSRLCQMCSFSSFHMATGIFIQ